MVKKHLFGFIGILGSMILASCAQQQEHPTATSLTEVTGIVVSDTLPAPVVAYLSDFEPPTLIKAAAPIYDSLSTSFGEGIPDITRYTTLDGLPQSITYRVLQGSDGTMWFLSVENLSKFDGTSYTTYNRANGLLEDAYANEFLLDSQGKIWISNDGITVFDGRSFTTYTTDAEGKELGEVGSIIEDNAGSIWMGTKENGLFRYENNQITRFTTDDGLKSNHIEGLLVDKEGLLMISTMKGTSQYDGTSITSYEALPEQNEAERNHGLFTDSKGNIWFHSHTEPAKIGKYDGSDITFYTIKEFDKDVNITDVIEDEQGNIWFSSSNGITYFDGSKFFHYSKANLGISNTSSVSSIAFDREGSLWAVVPREGVLKINRNLSFPEIPDGATAFYVIPDPSGDIWIQTSKGFGKYLENRIAFYGHELLADENYSSIQNPIFDRNGGLWFTLMDKRIEGRKLVSFDGSSYTFYGPEQGLKLYLSSRIRGISHDMQLLITSGNSTIEFDGEKITQQDFLQDVTIGSFLVDSKGNRWYGTENDGLYKYDGEKLFHLSTKTGLVSNKINRVTEDPLGNIWVGIDYGNARITNTTLSSFDAQDGLANLVGVINPDTVNNVLWFGTISGLVSLDFAQLNNENPGFQQYNYLTGFSIGPIVEPIPDIEGRIWGSGQSLFIFNYPALSDIPETTPYIKNIQINNQSVSWLSLSPSWAKTDSMATINEMGLKFKERLSGEQLEVQFDTYRGLRFDSVPAPDFVPVNLSLPYTNNTISFEFASVSPTYGKSIRYQYRLEGYDDRWSPLSTKKEANFGNLPEGRYTFQLKALNTGGNWSEISYPFTIRPPWFRTWWAYVSYVILFSSAIFGFISWRTQRLKEEKILLEKEVSNRTLELNQSLENLKSTQAQLIQSEKMASLGELTAGIAHEIQNPLNFVNNFSDINRELVEEAIEELDKGAITETRSILKDLGENSAKITHHGKRADAIVKGMLEHSRANKGEKAPTDLNALADEFVRLSYHGLRAKDKSFNSDFKLELDPNLPKVNVVASDIGRVILNLVNNAFYAGAERSRSKVDEKAKSTPRPSRSFGTGAEGGERYKPEVTVKTTMTKFPSGDLGVQISVQDNGNGIPDAIKEKIFQPFFTTKPTGSGTGLGLSLSYDIVKAHGGDLKVESKEGEGSEFIIQLPV
jgi:signal transduction histidine kinase/ligand-binding sensor domain-containing protein